MARIIIDEKVCKGCALCVAACPKGIIRLATDRLSSKGYHPAFLADEEQCTGCCSCAMMCPDVAITVER